MTLGHNLRALEAMNNSSMWITGMTLSHELAVIDAMNSLTLWMT